MHQRLSLCAVLLATAALTACSDQPEPAVKPEKGQQSGKFQGDRVWPGLAKGKCGSTLTVTFTDNRSEQYSPPETFFALLPSQDINQSENPRPAANLAEVMTKYSAESVRITPCEGQDIVLTQEKLQKRQGLLILTGKGLLKLAGEQDDDYITAVRKIKNIDFIGPELDAIKPTVNTVITETE